jgi:hypothetical protein
MVHNRILSGCVDLLFCGHNILSAITQENWTLKGDIIGLKSSCSFLNKWVIDYGETISKICTFS